MLRPCCSFTGCVLLSDRRAFVLPTTAPACCQLCATEMHEATRRVLGVLLRHLDGFDSTNKRTVVIGATNRKQVCRLQGWPAG